MIYFIYGDSEREQEAEKVIENIKRSSLTLLKKKQKLFWKV